MASKAACGSSEQAGWQGCPPLWLANPAHWARARTSCTGYDPLATCDRGMSILTGLVTQLLHLALILALAPVLT
ncbi:MAG: hypothetical protein ACKO54_26450, partial [Alphaproteobacteria bacterium]